MKLKQWLYGAAALSMLAACSDHDIAPSQPEEDGNGYIGVRIQLPTIPSTRANDNFDDGEASEYALTDAKLILFRAPAGSASTDATCLGAYDLRRSQSTADKDEDHDHITTQVVRVATVTEVDLQETDDLYALVITNGVGHDLYMDKLKDDAIKGKTIQYFQETYMNNDLYSQKYGKGTEVASNIVMTNSPLTESRGGVDSPNITSSIPVLVKLNSTIWPSEAEALANPAGVIHVERAVAKITCSSFNDKTDIEVTVDNKKYKLVVDEVYWDMAQDLTNSYVVRNTNVKPVGNPAGADLWNWNYASGYCDAGAFVNPAGTHRMVGHTAIINTLYRPYFCQVPGYGKKLDDIKEDKVFTKVTMERDDAVQLLTDVKRSVFYPRENTFPVDYMKYANTTRIGFWVTFKFQNVNDEDLYLDVKNREFFTRGLDKSTIYFDNPLENSAIVYLSENANVKKAVEDAMNKTTGSGYDDVELADLVDVSTNRDADDGMVTITNVEFKSLAEINEVKDGKYNGLFTVAPTYDFTGVIARLNNLETVYSYPDGKVFYEVRIKHFGDDLTPWDGSKLEHAGSIEESYGGVDTRSQNYLGRYGIVRNNWYDLNVEIITKLGDPEDPAKWDDTWPNKPNDNKDQYIAVIMRVLSWAKRTQSVKF